LFSRAGVFLKNVYNKYKFLIGIFIGYLMVFGGYKVIYYTSTDDFCGICHVHPKATYTWKKSTHYKNKSGVVVHCVECHLPQGGLGYFYEKSRLGVKDIYGTLFREAEGIDWEAKSVLEHAVTHTFDSSCLRCHADLYSLGLSPEGVEAHEYYMKTKDKIRCINCHITVGHFHAEPVEQIDLLAKEELKIPLYPPDTGLFENYTEVIPESDVTFNMIPIPEGEFLMGSLETERFGRDDEKFRHPVRISKFWMGETEVTWKEFDVFYEQTATREKNDDDVSSPVDTTKVDAITGPTPPYGSPDQGWGKGLRPAITMTHHAAVIYCEWLSRITGKKYRLPTEAEWEYACRAGTTGPYFFEGNPGELTEHSWKNRLFGTDDSIINAFAWYKRSSNNRTQIPYVNKPNPWGLYNMLGNVKEFCLDWYSPDIYITYQADSPAVNPTGPDTGAEHVIRSGSYKSDPAVLRSSARDHTYHDTWMITDPQSPKSKWWYSDSKDVGFRIVREFEE